MTKGLVRYQHSGQFHFLTFSCYRRLPLLNHPAACGDFECELERVRQRYEFVIAGYVLMPEHVHLLVGEPHQSSLAVALQVMKQQTSKKLKSAGTAAFWQARYYDFNVYNKTTEKLRYMHRNPVKRGLVSRPRIGPGPVSVTTLRERSEPWRLNRNGPLHAVKQREKWKVRFCEPHP